MNGWGLHSNADNGRTWIMYRNHIVDVRVIKKHKQFIHCELKFQSFSCALDRVDDPVAYISIVYAKCLVTDRRSLWNHLSSIASSDPHLNQPSDSRISMILYLTEPPYAGSNHIRAIRTD